MGTYDTLIAEAMAADPRPMYTTQLARHVNRYASDTGRIGPSETTLRNALARFADQGAVTRTERGQRIVWQWSATMDDSKPEATPEATPEVERPIADDRANGAGVMLPGVDPTIGELVLATLNNNPAGSLSEIAVSLIKGAPNVDVAVEMMDALVEMTLCKAVGQLRWVDESGSTILAGIRPINARQAVSFGNAAWPMDALMMAEPRCATIDTGHGRRRVWMACEGLDSVDVRQTEAIALGNSMIELFGGRIIEDREGHKVMRQQALERHLTGRAQARANAITRGRELRQATKKVGQAYPGHARTALQESQPGTLDVGDRLQPVGGETMLPGSLVPVYRVEERVDAEWLVIVAEEAGVASQVEAGPWGKMDDDGTPGVCGYTVGVALANAASPAPA